MANLSMRALSKALENSPLARKAFKSGIQIILNVLEHQRLIDKRQLENVAMDWNKGVLSLGDGFVETLVGRTISQYIVDYKKKAFDYRLKQTIEDKYKRKDENKPN